MFTSVAAAGAAGAAFFPPCFPPPPLAPPPPPFADPAAAAAASAAAEEGPVMSANRCDVGCLTSGMLEGSRTTEEGVRGGRAPVSPLSSLLPPLSTTLKPLKLLLPPPLALGWSTGDAAVRDGSGGI